MAALFSVKQTQCPPQLQAVTSVTPLASASDVFEVYMSFITQILC